MKLSDVGLTCSCPGDLEHLGFRSLIRMFSRDHQLAWEALMCSLICKRMGEFYQETLKHSLAAIHQ